MPYLFIWTEIIRAKTNLEFSASEEIHSSRPLLKAGTNETPHRTTWRVSQQRSLEIPGMVKVIYLCWENRSLQWKIIFG